MFSHIMVGANDVQEDGPCRAGFSNDLFLLRGAYHRRVVAAGRVVYVCVLLLCTASVPRVLLFLRAPLLATYPPG